MIKSLRKLFKMKLKHRAVFSMLLGMVVLTISAAIVSFVTYTNAMKNKYGDQAMNLAKTIATIVDTEDAKNLTNQVMTIYRSQCQSDGSAPDFDSFTPADWDAYYEAFKPVYQTPEYKRLFDQLYSVKECNEVLWVYICYMDEKTGKAVYIIDAEIQETACNIGKCDAIEDGNLNMMQHNIYDFPAYITNYPEYGWLCSSAAGIRDENGNVIANTYVDISMTEVMNTNFSFLRNLLILLFVSAIVICVLYSYTITKGIVNPINQLAAATSDFVSEKQSNYKGEETQISKLSIKTGDEIETLATSIQKMEKEINYYITNLTNVTAEKERIGTELRVASKIQQETLPCILPEIPEKKGMDLYAKMFPSVQPGGDFYDVFLQDEDHLVILVASATGKGVPAALFMVIVKSLIRNQLQEGKSMEEIFFIANNQLWKDNESAIFACVWCGILEISTGVLRYSSAGAENPILVEKNGVGRVLPPKENSLPIAAWEDTSYQTYEITLQRGDILFLYNAAVTEACNADKEAFGTVRLKEELEAHSKEKMNYLINNLYEDLGNYTDWVEQDNDIIMLALRYGEQHFTEEN